MLAHTVSEQFIVRYCRSKSMVVVLAGNRTISTDAFPLLFPAHSVWGNSDHLDYEVIGYI